MFSKNFIINLLLSILGLGACDTYIEGEPGPQGPAGEKGEKGDPGSQGEKGKEGERVYRCLDGYTCPDGYECGADDRCVLTEGEEVVDECVPYIDYPQRGQYVNSLVEATFSDDLVIGTAPGEAHMSLRMGMGIEGQCGSGVVINSVFVQSSSVPVAYGYTEADATSLYLGDENPGAAFFQRPCGDTTFTEHFGFATCEVGGYILPPRQEAELLVGVLLPDVTEAQAADIRLVVAVNVTDVDSGNHYQVSWSFAPPQQ